MLLQLNMTDWTFPPKANYITKTYALCQYRCRYTCMRDSSIEEELAFRISLKKNGFYENAWVSVLLIERASFFGFNRINFGIERTMHVIIVQMNHLKNATDTFDSINKIGLIMIFNWFGSYTHIGSDQSVRVCHLTHPPTQIVTHFNGDNSSLRLN